MIARLSRRLGLLGGLMTVFANVAAQPFCNGAIFTDTTLSSDILGCPGRGLIVVTSNVTLDCADHTVESLGNRVIEVNPGLSNVTVKNCELRSSAGTEAIRVQAGTSDITITNNRITTSGLGGSGVRLLGTTDSAVSGNTISTTGLNANGIRLHNSPSNVLADNDISTSGPSGRGFRLRAGSNGNVVSGNVVHTTGQGGNGIEVRAGANGNLVQGNTFRTENAPPVRIESASGNLFHDNSLQSTVGWFRSRRFPLQNGGMSVHPDGRVFAVENNFGGGFGVGTTTSMVEIDPATGDVMNVIRLVHSGTDFDLGFGFDALEITSDPIPRFLALQGGGSGLLYEINPDTGEVAFLFFVSSFGGSINGLASNGPGSLLATTNSGNLVSINLLGMFSIPIGFGGLGWTDLAIDPTSGRAYGLSRHVNEASQSNHLYEINPMTGAVITEVGDLGLAFVSDMDFAPDGKLYGNDGSLLLIDPADATAQSLGGFGEDPFEPPSEMNALEQTTMVAADGSGSLHYPGVIALPDGVATNVSTSVLEISFNRVFVDSLNFPFLDQPATNTLLGLTGEQRILLVDEEDDGEFEECTPPRCTLVSFAGGTLVFDVSGFTTYSSRACASNAGKGPGGDGPPGPDGNGPPGLCKAKGPDGNGPPGLTGEHPQGGPPGQTK